MSYKIYKGVHEKRRGENPETVQTRVPEGFTKKTLDDVAEILQDYMESSGNKAETLFKYLSKKDVEGLEGAYIKRLEEVIDLRHLLENKDLFMEDKNKEMDGSFYTPVIWAEESRKFFEETYDLSEYTVWDPAAGTGNLVEPYIGKCKQVYASTLDEGDVAILAARHKDIEAFQLDFLSTNDIKTVVPEGLRQVIENNEPLLILTNPPYSKAGSKSTWVYSYLDSQGDKVFKNDLLKQFIWQLGNMFSIYNMSNARLVLIGTTSLFLRNTWNGTLKYLYEHYELERGYFFKASEFKGIFDVIAWGVFTLLLKPHEVLQILNKVPETTLEIRERDPDTDIITVIGEQTLSSESTTSRVAAKKYFSKPASHKVMQPVFSAYGIKRVNEKGKDIGKTMLQAGTADAECYYLTSAHISMMAMYNGISLLPLTSVAYPVTRARYKDTISAFMFSAYMHNALDYYERIKLWHIPSPSEKYSIWQANAVVGSMGHPKFFSYTVRDADIDGYAFTKLNTFLPYTQAEVEAMITCPVKLEDFKNNPMDNDWYVNMVREALPLLDDRVKAMYDKVMELYAKMIKAPYDSENELTRYYDVGLTQGIKLGVLSEEDKDAIAELRIKSSEWFRENYKDHYVY